MFIFYVTQHASGIGQWRDFAEEIANKQDDLLESEISQQEFDAWILPKNHAVGVDLLLLHEMMRLADYHTDMRATTDQKQFLSQLASKTLPSSLSKYSLNFSAMLSTLQKQTLRRKKCECDTNRAQMCLVAPT
jgi:hypothetical protein